MKAPDKIYVHEISAEELTENLPYHVCYLRKDFVAEMLDTVENHAFLDGQEKLKEELLEWAKAEIELSKKVECVSEKSYEEGRQQVAQNLIDKLNSM